MTGKVICGILVSNGSILLGRRAKKLDDPIGGKWVTPGGHVEEGETLDQALEREYLEETGLIVRSIDDFLHVDQTKEWLLFKQVICLDLSTLSPSTELPEIELHTWKEIVHLHEKGITTPETFTALKEFLQCP